MKLKTILRFTLIFSFLFLAQCETGEDPDTAAIDFGINPAKPVVINSNASYVIPADPAINNDVDQIVAITGPWFYVQPYFKNNSAGWVTIQTVTFTVSAIDKVTGADVIVEESLDPGLLPEMTNGQVPDGTFFIAELGPAGTATSEYLHPELRWYIDSLPKKAKVVSLNYRITAEAIGWFGDRNNPSKTFRKKIHLTPAN